MKKLWKDGAIVGIMIVSDMPASPAKAINESFCRVSSVRRKDSTDEKGKFLL